MRFSSKEERLPKPNSRARHPRGEININWYMETCEGGGAVGYRHCCPGGIEVSPRSNLSRSHVIAFTRRQRRAAGRSVSDEYPCAESLLLLLAQAGVLRRVTCKSMALRFAFSVQATRARFRFHTRSAWKSTRIGTIPAGLATFQSLGNYPINADSRLRYRVCVINNRRGGVTS